MTGGTCCNGNRERERSPDAMGYGALCQFSGPVLTTLYCPTASVAYLLLYATLFSGVFYSMPPFCPVARNISVGTLLVCLGLHTVQVPYHPGTIRPIQRNTTSTEMWGWAKLHRVRAPRCRDSLAAVYWHYALRSNGLAYQYSQSCSWRDEVIRLTGDSFFSLLHFSADINQIQIPSYYLSSFTFILCSITRLRSRCQSASCQ